MWRKLGVKQQFQLTDTDRDQEQIEEKKKQVVITMAPASPRDLKMDSNHFSQLVARKYRLYTDQLHSSFDIPPGSYKSHAWHGAHKARAHTHKHARTHVYIRMHTRNTDCLWNFFSRSDVTEGFVAMK